MLVEAFNIKGKSSKLQNRKKWHNPMFPENTFRRYVVINDKLLLGNLLGNVAHDRNFTKDYVHALSTVGE